MRLILRSLAAALLLSALGKPSSALADAGDDRYVIAAEHYAAQNWAEACGEFRKLLDTAPDHPRALQARFFYGEALAQLGRYTDARAQFGALLERDAEHRYARQALFRRGEAAYLGDQATEARQDLEAFRTRFPQDELNGYVLAYLANLDLRAGDAAAAEKLYEAAIEQFPEGPLVPECRLGLAEAQEQLGRLERARDGYRALAEKEGPLAEHALVHLAATENALGDHPAALKSLESFTERFPTSELRDKARLGHGYTLYKLSRYQQAEELLQGLTTHPKLRVEAYYWLGMSQKARQQWHTAAETLLAGAKLDVQHRLAEALGYQAADALLRDGQYQAARDEFKRVLNAWPNGSWADDCWYGIVRACAQQNLLDDSVVAADTFLKEFAESPLRPQVELAKGQALLVLGRYVDAVEPLEDCLKHLDAAEPSSKAALRSQTQAALGACFAKLGRLNEAKGLIDGLRSDKAPDALAAETGYQLAESALAAGDIPLASEQFQALVAQAGSTEAICQPLSGLGWCYFKSERWNDAAATFDRILNQFPQNSLAAEAALMRGRALEHLKRPDEAMAMYGLVIERYAATDRLAEALWHAARLHDERHENSQAITLYTRLLDEHPQFDQLDVAIYRCAWLLRETDEADRAAKLFERLHHDFPRSSFASEAALRLAEHAAAKEQYDVAERLLTEITQPGTPPDVRQHALYLQGQLALARERWSEVESALGQLIETYPAGELALPAAHLRAEASYRQGRFEEAAARLAELANQTKGQEKPWSATAELRRAQALAQLKEWSEALEIARSIRTQFPNFNEQYEVDYLIGRCLAAGADFAGARLAYAKVIESPQASKTQTAAMARWMIGETYFHQENYAQALAEYLQVDESYPFPRWQAAALLQAGKCHELLGHWHEAADVYNRLLKDFPASQLSDEAQRRMAIAEKRLAAPVKLK